MTRPIIAVNVLIRHADSYRDKRVVIVGDGNTACDAAVDLSSVCSQVTQTVVCTLNINRL